MIRPEAKATGPSFVCGGRDLVVTAGPQRPATCKSIFSMKQLLLAPEFKSQSIFGGSLLNRGTNPKCARPLDTKLPQHLVLKAERSTMRLPKYSSRVDDLVRTVARKWNIRVYEYANVGNHRHLLLKVSSRGAWRAFIRELSGRIARALLALRSRFET